VPFRFNFSGWGFTDGDFVRIIPSSATSACSDNQNNPSGAFAATYVKIACPYPCSKVGQITDQLNGDISVQVLSDGAYKCDRQNANCRNNDIIKIVVLDDQTTQIEFEAPHGLKTGDLITISENVVCAPDNNPSRRCNDEKVAAIMGRFRMADSLNNEDNWPDASDYFETGHAITYHEANDEPKVLTILLGGS
jgi:hypothetical protein